MMKKNELTEKEIETINHQYADVDELYKRFGGVSSSLEGYKNGILYLRVTNIKYKISPSYYTALRYAHSWKDFNPELQGAIGFVIFFMDADEANEKEDAMASENHSIKELNGHSSKTMDESKKEVPVPNEIFSGLLSNEKDDVANAIEKDIQNFGVGDEEISKLNEKEKLMKILFSKGHVSFLDSAWIREIYRRIFRLVSDKELLESFNSARIRYSNLYLAARRMSIIEEFGRRDIDFNCIVGDNGKSYSFKHKLKLVKKGSKKHVEIDTSEDTK
jgi:hypothetical protein